MWLFASLVKAAEAYQQAADLGDAWAMVSLAQMLGQGNGVPADFDRAKALLSGFQMHLAKPVDPVELLAAVARLASQGSD